MILVKRNKVYTPQHYKWESSNDTIEPNDFSIKLPNLDLDEVGYATLSIINSSNQTDKLNYGYVCLDSIRCTCKKEEPLYHGLPDRKKFIYLLTLNLIDKNSNISINTLEATDISFVVKTIIPYINLALKEGYLCEELNWEWIKWQCTVWNFCEVNGQGRTFSYEDNSITNSESLYDFIGNIRVTVRQESINRVGKDNDFWKEVSIVMPQTHKYLASLFSAALGVEAILNNDKQTFILKIEKETAYSHAVSYELSLKETEVYKEQFIKILRIYCIKKFDIQKMNILSFVK